jgi:polyvinyl alcohol dehydrogenase (cytochrome)
VIAVTTLADSGPGSLRQAILDANAHRGRDTITFRAHGTIELAAALPDLTGDLTIEGPRPNQLTVRRDTGGNYRIFTVDGGATVVLAGLTIADGAAAAGGGVLNDGGTLTIEHCVLLDNLAQARDAEGGGVCNPHGTLTVRDSTFTGNTVKHVGFGNGSAAGGALSNDGRATVTGSTLSDNSSNTGDGGGIANGGTMKLGFSTVSHNQGAGINNLGTLAVHNSTLAANRNDNFAGAGGIENEGKLTVRNSTISGNSALVGAGGIDNLLGDVSLQNSTLSDNTVDDPQGFSGAQIFADNLPGGSFVVRNTIFAGHSNAPNIFGTPTSEGHNLNSDGSGGLNGTGDLLNTDPLLGPLQDNGGPTLTQALSPGSPAIDAGDDTGARAFDQRGPGFARIVNSTIDIGAFEVQNDPGDWAMYNHDGLGSRDNAAEHFLSPTSVRGLKVQWAFPTKAVVAGTPTVADGRIYAADASGTVYALRPDGTLLWSSQVAGPVTGSILATHKELIFGDLAGNVYGLSEATGAELWKVHLDSNPTAGVFGSATPVGKYVAVGVASVEELVAGQIPGYKPSFRGSLVLLDPSDGHLVWQTYTVSGAESQQGASGAGIWSTPTYDPDSNTIYVTTGNNYSEPTTGQSDAIIAFDATTGQVKWVNQRTRDDSWNFQFPDSKDHPDFDFGDSPQVYWFNGRKVVGAGQKSGFYHVVDAATGVAINQIQVEEGGELSGLFADSAVADGVVFANTSNWPHGFQGGQPVSGSLVAIGGDGTRDGLKELWHFTTPGSPNLSGVAVANGVVYFQSSLDGNLYALDARTGALLAKVATGGQESGPAVSHGHVYLGVGNAFALLGDLQHPPPGAIMALGLDNGP